MLFHLMSVLVKICLSHTYADNVVALLLDTVPHQRLIRKLGLYRRKKIIIVNPLSGGCRGL